MGSARRRAIVAVLLGAYAVLLVLGPRFLGAWSGGVVLVASLAGGFAWLVLVVAPWAAHDRARGAAARHDRP